MLIRDAANTDALDSLSELQRRVRVLSGRAASEKRKVGLSFVLPDHCRQPGGSFAFLFCFSLIHYMQSQGRCCHGAQAIKGEL